MLGTPPPPPPPAGGGGGGGAAGARADAVAGLDTTKWAARRDRNAVLRDILRGRAAGAMSDAAALDRGPIDLPGPTGESNRYMQEPRGQVLCLGPGEALLDQVIQALAAGNAVVAVAPDFDPALRELADAGLPLALSSVPDWEELRHAPLNAVAWAGDAEGAAKVRRLLAARQGPIIPLIRSASAPGDYSNERAICIDTTAAGGNTALLAANA